MKSLLILGLIFAVFQVSLPASYADQGDAVQTKKPAHSVKKKSAKKRKKKQALKTNQKKAARDDNANLSTDISFNDSVLHGHYQTPDEATARVENEKLLSDLLGVRTHFKDRLQKASEQN